MDISFFWYQALESGMSEIEFWLSTPRKIMLRLMYKGIENGVLKTKEAERERLLQQQSKWDRFAPAIDMRKKDNKNGG